MWESTGLTEPRPVPAQSLCGCDIDSSGPRLARARSSFFGDGEVADGLVRAPIAASWKRARDWNVDTGRIGAPRPAEFDDESPLVRAARPVLDEMEGRFSGESTSLILCDASGVVLDRRSGDTALNRRMDEVWLVPGHSYAEQVAGTNGIGTALADNRPAFVFGHEHYVDDLVALACAGYPIRHPVSGELLGVVDLTCWNKDANQFMELAVLAVARRIEESLLTQAGTRELGVVHEYLAAERESRSALFGVSDDLLMMNRQARELLDPEDRAALLAEAASILDSGRDRTILMDLPSGVTARVQCLPSSTGAGCGVLKVRLATDTRTSTVASGAASYSTFGVVGSAPLWQRCVESVDRHLTEGNWMILDGEAGVGKTAVAVAAHRLRKPTTHLVVADLADPARTWHDDVAGALAEDNATIVLRHLHALDDDGAGLLADLLEPCREMPGPSRPVVVATLTDGVVRNGDLSALTRLLAVSVTVPPLRHHSDDIRDLVTVLVARLGQGASLQFTAAATRHLVGNPWPGNIRQVRQVISKILSRRRAGTVDVADLPVECRSSVRRVLTPLETMECDAIIRALDDARGDKARAARQLGTSRATIYRKIREFGINLA